MPCKPTLEGLQIYLHLPTHASFPPFNFANPPHCVAQTICKLFPEQISGNSWGTAEILHSLNHSLLFLYQFLSHSFIYLFLLKTLFYWFSHLMSLLTSFVLYTRSFLLRVLFYFQKYSPTFFPVSVHFYFILFHLLKLSHHFWRHSLLFSLLTN